MLTQRWIVGSPLLSLKHGKGYIILSTPRTTVLILRKITRFHHTCSWIVLDVCGDDTVSHIFMYKLMYRDKTNITFTINIPVPSSTVHFFLLSNFMNVQTRRRQWRISRCHLSNLLYLIFTSYNQK